METPISIFVCHKKVLVRDETGREFSQENLRASILHSILQLRSKEYDVWIDESEIGAGMAWETEIYNRLLVSDVLLLAIGPGTSKSEWVRREIALATALGIAIVPLGYDMTQDEFGAELKELQIEHIQGKLTQNIKHAAKEALLQEIDLDIRRARETTLRDQARVFASFSDRRNTGLDLTRVRVDDDGRLSTKIGRCEIGVIYGRIEEYSPEPDVAIALPCNEYFDDECAGDSKSALGAYVSRAFKGQASGLVSLVKDECQKRFGLGSRQEKEEGVWAESFGIGRCLLLKKPLSSTVPIALVSTTTQRAGQGLAARISYLFAGMGELVKCLADARINEVAMPVLGAGHGGIDPPLAFVGLLSAVAEAARYGQGGHFLRRVTIVVFRRDLESRAEVDRALVGRALALIGDRHE
jgi:hypothetical protein